MPMLAEEFQKPPSPEHANMPLGSVLPIDQGEVESIDGTGHCISGLRI